MFPPSLLDMLCKLTLLLMVLVLDLPKLLALFLFMMPAYKLKGALAALGSASSWNPTILRQLLAPPTIF